MVFFCAYHLLIPEKDVSFLTFVFVNGVTKLFAPIFFVLPPAKLFGYAEI